MTTYPRYRFWLIDEKVMSTTFGLVAVGDFIPMLVALGHGEYMTIFIDKEPRKVIPMLSAGIRLKGVQEIFLDDILLVPDQYTDDVDGYGNGPTEPWNHLARVVFKDGSFGVELTGSGDFHKKGFHSFEQLSDDMNLEELELLGNIHENPDLYDAPPTQLAGDAAAQEEEAAVLEEAPSNEAAAPDAATASADAGGGS